ncbi:tRNA (adenosine(37)-N6)-dimethylallyltransferase MiaA [Trichloromonas sp.]|uniref:tRNA (adenosine(37)-N6)-dimethylallyltransferase MiaA n=1 Tax=Trichloromonas sp. TaxID=3069249 RepID=UPI003D819542
MASPKLHMEPRPLLVICGPTASGKTALAIDLCRHFDIEVVSADSRQVYRGLDIGTAKATAEERRKVPHHLIDVVDPDEDFSVADFVGLATDAVDQIHERGRLPAVVGGTGLYIKGLTEGLLAAPGGDRAVRDELLAIEREQGSGTLYRRLGDVDPQLAAKLFPGDLLRIVRALEVHALSGRRLSDYQQEHGFDERPYETLKIALTPQREILYRRINQRVEQMFNDGLLDEVRQLLDRGYAPELKSMRTIGYRESILHLQGHLSLDEAIALIQRDSRRYAKRQLTWFRRDNSIIWVDSFAESAKIQKFIEHFMHRTRSGYGQDPF